MGNGCCRRHPKSCTDWGGAATPNPSIDLTQWGGWGVAPRLACNLTAGLRMEPDRIVSVGKAWHHAASVNLSAAQEYAFWRVTRRAGVGHRVQLVALGGSLVAGAKCHDAELSERECSFASRFGKLLQQGYATCSQTQHKDGGTGSSSSVAMNSASLEHHVRFEYHNRAQGGLTSPSILPSLPYAVADGQESGKAADVVMIDFSVNDQWEGNEGTDPAWVARVGAATEGILRYLLAVHPSTAILLWEGSCSSAATMHQERFIAAAYGVAFLTYGELLAGPCDRTAWEPAPAQRHPTHVKSQTHVHLAHALGYWWDALDARLAATSSEMRPKPLSLPTPISPLSLLDTQKVCQPLAIFDAAEAHRATLGDLSGGSTGGRGPMRSLVPAVTKGNWSLIEDREGKPGWITTGPVGSRIEFAVAFGAEPRLQVVYDRSYEGFGSAEIVLYRAAKPARGEPPSQFKALVLNGTRHASESSVTQAELRVIHEVWFGMAALSNGTVVLRLLTEGKFKLRILSSC